jgi:hypothetical protein
VGVLDVVIASDMQDIVDVEKVTNRLLDFCFLQHPQAAACLMPAY